MNVAPFFPIGLGVTLLILLVFVIAWICTGGAKDEEDE